MYVCICNGITDGAIRDAAARGVGTLEELTMRTGCGSGCGSCIDIARQILDEARAPKIRAFSLPFAAAA